MYKEVLKIIKKSKKIYIVTHKRPDGDAIGSSFAMYIALKNMKKDVTIIMQEYMKKYEFLSILKEAKENVIEEKYDLLICMDSGSCERLEISEEDYNKASKIVVFDHHQMNNIAADVKIVDENSPANCELIYEFFVKNKIEISKDMADLLYLGIMTDTGSFNYKRTTARSYFIASKLLEKGADFVTICRRINDTYSENKLKLLGHIINNMESFADGQIMFSLIKKETMEKINANDEDTDSLVNYLRMVDGTEVAVLVYPIDNNNYKVSMRTQGKVDCSKIAREFGGGGHIRASGFETDDVNKIKNALIERIKKEL